MEQRQAQGEQGLLSKQVTEELAAIGKQRFQDFVSAQDELLNQLRKVNEMWLDRLRSDTNLASEFTWCAARPIPTEAGLNGARRSGRHTPRRTSF